MDDHIPTYDTPGAIDDALSAVKARWDHGDAPYDPDVLAVIRAAEAMRAKLYGPVEGDPMPVFVLKGTDQLTPETIAFYRRRCNVHGLVEQAAEVTRALDEMEAWQDRNRDLVHMPDHPHVPVTGSPDPADA